MQVYIQTKKSDTTSQKEGYVSQTLIDLEYRRFVKNTSWCGNTMSLNCASDERNERTFVLEIVWLTVS